MFPVMKKKDFSQTNCHSHFLQNKKIIYYGEKTSFNVITHQFLNATIRDLYFVWQFPYKVYFCLSLMFKQCK